MGLIAACAMAFGVLAGCGGSDNNATDEEIVHLTKPQYVRQANVICGANSGELKAEIEAGAGDLGGISRAAELAPIVPTVVVPSLEAQWKEIRALRIPTPIKDRHEIFVVLDVFKEVIEEATADPRGFTRHPTFVFVQQAADNYGLTECPGGLEMQEGIPALAGIPSSS